MLDGVSALDHIRLQEALSPIVSPCACVGCCARLPEVLSPFVSHCLPTCDLCWMVRPLSRGLVSPLSPIVSLFFACVGWCVRLPQVLSPLSPSLSSFMSPSLSPNLSFFLFPFVVGSLILHFFKQCTVGVSFLKVSALLLDGLSAFPRSCLLYCLPVCLSSCFPLWRVVSFCTLLSSDFAFFPNSVRSGILNAFSCHVFDLVPQHDVLNPPTVWGLRWCNFTSHSTLTFFALLTLYTPHSTLPTLHSTLYTPRFTLHTLHSTLHTLHCTLVTPHCTLHFPLHTPPSTLSTPHCRLVTGEICTRLFK